MRDYTLSYSPCPNDTYIFAALTNGLLENAPRVHVHLADIQELNDAAAAGEPELVKVSYGAIPYLMDEYTILRAGGALGRGCGPLLITRPGASPNIGDYRNARIAIPGERTTAFMLLRLALGGTPQAVPMRFDAIVDAVAGDRVDAGLIIHESRFTYQEHGLQCAIDLGEWWERETGNPIPLGAILARNDVREAHAIDDAIRRSLAFARSNEAAIMPYVREHAFEMREDVMRKHIDLYVNAFSEDVGPSGISAARDLFMRAHAANLIPEVAEPRFIAA